MGVKFSNMHSYHEYGDLSPHEHYPKQVLALAKKVVAPLLDQDLGKISHLIMATTCPDSIAPSLGQQLTQVFNPHFTDTHVIDIVQGCAGGVTALLLGSQLATVCNSNVLVVIADAAKKACDRASKNYSIFGNGSFACILTGGNYATNLIHYKSKQYKELLNVVQVKLGHDADLILAKGLAVNQNPRKYLGLEMNNSLALKLIKEAKFFYEEFLSESRSRPDVMILHQVNTKIIKHLQDIFEIEGINFVNVSELTGNCGTASIGLALKHSESNIEGKKVFICSFGTGGVITAGLWQF
ncbi:hypothetical protein AHMF7605_03375 [Adhaeribacter arboris]|uniref:3-oxoacyl-ACP synthase n=1 Tax=Adhaeribacter arboris TaxID=2072846 RepID=A0A2T2YAU4_9BACT|nr:3-oxoacyl-[acyl-carrier-protein] synthase III C-terminal domain-containing protein [Adhaeribacter arboris]PSR52632.1 hypothetical protein AHMF7605_03375 [Adhaeribacter arboris]